MFAQSSRKVVQSISTDMGVVFAVELNPRHPGGFWGFFSKLGKEFLSLLTRGTCSYLVKRRLVIREHSVVSHALLRNGMRGGDFAFHAGNDRCKCFLCSCVLFNQISIHHFHGSYVHFRMGSVLHPNILQTWDSL